MIGALPGGDKLIGQGQVDENVLDNMEVIIDSMTKLERQKPDLLNASRRKRIAAGAGVSVTDVNNLIKRYNDMRKMVKKMMSGHDDVKAKRPRKGGGGKKKRNKKRRQNLAILPNGMTMKDVMTIANEVKLK